jgi:hypothetical protein
MSVRPSAQVSARLVVLPGGLEEAMHTIRPDDVTGDQKALVEDFWEQVQDITPGSRLGLLPPSAVTEEALGYRIRRPRSATGVYWTVCPSASQVGRWWELRVSWHEGAYVQAGHYGHGCPAWEVNRRCWHEFAAVRKIAAIHYGGQVPTGAAPLHATPDPRPRPEKVKDRPPPFPVDKAFYG